MLPGHSRNRERGEGSLGAGSKVARQRGGERLDAGAVRGLLLPNNTLSVKTLRSNSGIRCRLQAQCFVRLRGSMELINRM